MIPNQENDFEKIDRQLRRLDRFFIIGIITIIICAVIFYSYFLIPREEQPYKPARTTHEGTIGTKPINNFE